MGDSIIRTSQGWGLVAGFCPETLCRRTVRDKTFEGNINSYLQADSTRKKPSGHVAGGFRGSPVTILQ